MSRRSLEVHDTSSNKRSRREDASCLLFQYQFFMPLLLAFLEDEDVLTRLLLAGKSCKPYFFNYCLKECIKPARAREITSWHRYFAPAIVYVHGVTTEDLRPYPKLNIVAFDSHFDPPISCCTIPPGVKQVRLDGYFNSKLMPGMIPPSVEYLRFGDSFNQPLQIGSIPFGVHTVLFGNEFNQPLNPGIIPDSVTHLQLGEDFARGILPGSLPSSITELTICNKFPMDQSMMPPFLTFLDVDRYEYELFFPSTLEKLHIGSVFNNMGFRLSHFPASLTELYIGRVEDSLEPGLLPSTIKKLKIHEVSQIVADSIPNSVTELSCSWLDCDFVPVGSVPSSVTRLVLKDLFGDLQPGVIPNSVTHLTITFSDASGLMPGVLPCSITHLDMDRDSGRYDHPLLTTDKQCQCDDYPNQHMISTIPASVSHLTLSKTFNQKLQPDLLPLHLTHLTLGTSYSHPISSDDFPPSLRFLVVGKLSQIPAERGCLDIQCIAPAWTSLVLIE